jgi:tRNA(fMet)-specific endonuclease VapC
VAVLVDTDLLIDWERSGDAAALDRLIGDEERALSVVTVSELLHGAARARAGHATTRRAFVEHILMGMEPVPITEAVARVHAEIWVELERLGGMIGAHDLWIAATAIAHGFGIATGNSRDFSRVPGLRVLSLAG